MSFTGNENQTITLSEASQMTEDFRTNNPGKRLGGYFSKSSLNDILNQTNCVGIRYYNAEDSNGNHTIVLVGVIANQNDIVLGEIKQHALPFPPYDSVNNDLNS